VTVDETEMLVRSMRRSGAIRMGLTGVAIFAVGCATLSVWRRS
jgi:hypothetical protein